MITTNAKTESETKAPHEHVALVRYGRIPQVARFGLDDASREQIRKQLHSGRQPDVVVETDRGTEIGQLLEVVRPGIVSEELPTTGSLVRIATDEDSKNERCNRSEAEAEFFTWQDRISEWELQLQIIDMEWTLDRSNVILYVLNDQDAETTRLALLAAAGGFGIIHVQPVNAGGIEHKASGGGCGSGGCGSGGCGH